MYVSEAWSGARPRRLVSLVLGALLVGLLATPYLRDFAPDDTSLMSGAVAWDIAAVVVAALLVAYAIYCFVKAPTWRQGLLEALPSFLLLLIPVPAWLGLEPALGLIPVLVAFLLMIRDLARGHALAFSAIAIFGILLVSSIFMADVEEEAGEGRMRHWWQAMFWGAGQILRFDRGVNMYAPQTDLGKWIGIAVITSGVLFSAILLSALTSWAVNAASKGKDDKVNRAFIAKAVDEAIERALMAMNRPDAAAAYAAAAMGPGESEPTADEGEQRVWIDVERIVGSQPFSWWHSRWISVPAYVERLREADPTALPTLLDGELALLVVVVEGRGCSEAEGESMTAAGQRLVVVHAAGTTVDEIRARVRAGDVVVTDNPDLSRGLTQRGVRVMAPVGAPTSAA